MISIVVCTYNRSNLLSQCLQSLSQQTAAKDAYEVVIVDNASTDDTPQVVQKFLASEPNFTSCREERRGANHSRNTGAQAARGEYLAFIDDDAVAYSNWVEGVLAFTSRRPDVAVFGGPYDAHSFVPVPPWFPPEYGTLSLGNEERPIRVGKEWVTGTNLVVKKAAFMAVGGFHKKLGSVENGVFFYGEEIRLIVELFRSGSDVYYAPSIPVSHLIREDKMNLKHLVLSGYRIGRTAGLTIGEKRSVLRHLLGVTVAIAKGALVFCSSKGCPLKRKIYYALYPVMYESAALVESLASRGSSDF